VNGRPDRYVELGERCQRLVQNRIKGTIGQNQIERSGYGVRHWRNNGEPELFAVTLGEYETTIPAVDAPDAQLYTVVAWRTVGQPVDKLSYLVVTLGVDEVEEACDLW